MKEKLVFIVIPHHWDTLWGRIEVFDNIEDARWFAKHCKSEVTLTIEARYINEPGKKMVQTKEVYDEFKEDY